MVETIEDAIDTCKRSMINFIYIPEDQDIDVQQYQVSEEELKKLQAELEESVSEEDDTHVKLSADKGAFINS